MIVVKSKEADKKIAELSGKLEINESGQKAQFIGNFLNVEFPIPGEYIVEIYIDGKKQTMKTNFLLHKDLWRKTKIPLKRLAGKPGRNQQQGL